MPLNYEYFIDHICHKILAQDGYNKIQQQLDFYPQ